MQVLKEDGSYEMPEEFNLEKMLKRLQDPDVESVRVFQATPDNVTLAEYRHLYPKLSRKQLKQRIKYDRERKTSK